MNHRILALLCLVLLLCLGSIGTTLAQGDDNACPAFVEAAIFTVGENCAGLGRDEVCYGYNRVDATFWQPQAEDFFAAPADRIALVDVQTLHTAPLSLDGAQWGLALLRLQADLPETQPGQAVTFLLMGDATLENAVPAPPPVTPVAATASTGINLRSGPSANANIVGSVPAGGALALVGVNAAGDWYEVALEEGGTAWVFAELVTPGGDLSALPVSSGDEAVSRYAPMQAFYFNAGFGEPQCSQAPDALVVQSPRGVQVALNVNGLDVTLGSTAVFSMNALPDGTPLLVVSLLEGSLTARFGSTIAAQLISSDALAVTLNSSGQVDAASQVVEVVAAPEAAQAVTANACLVARLAADSGLLDLRLLRFRCEREIAFVPNAIGESPAAADAGESSAPEGADALSSVGAGDACTVAPGGGVNLRGGPGTNYPRQGQLAAGEAVTVSGQVGGVDGYDWWQLSSGAWVRGDLVRAAGACAAVPLVESTPVPPAPSGSGGSGGSTGGSSGGSSGVVDRDRQGYYINECILPANPQSAVQEGELISFVFGVGPWPTYAEAQAGTATILLDGAAMAIEGFSGLGALTTGGFAKAVYSVNWRATAGSHTVTGITPTNLTNGGYTNSCTFTVAAAANSTGAGSGGGAVTVIHGLWQMTPGLGSCSTTAGTTSVRFATCTGMYASNDLALAAAPSVFNVATIDGQPGPAFVQVGLNQFSPGVCWETAAVTLTPGPHEIVIAQTVGVQYDSGPVATTSVASCTYMAQ